jgi:hypothetical protein
MLQSACVHMPAIGAEVRVRHCTLSGLSAIGDTFQIVLTCADNEASVCVAQIHAKILFLHLQVVEPKCTLSYCSPTDSKTDDASRVPAQPFNVQS